jgi:hypothetical protein
VLTKDEARAARTKKRLACALVIDGNRLAGIVLDLSSSGLFVQTSANPNPGTRLDVELEIPGEPERPRLAARVARKKVVPPRLKGVVHGGVGLKIESAPESFFRYLAQLQIGEAGGESPAEAAPAEKAPASQKPAGPEKAPAPKKAAPTGKNATRGGAASASTGAKQERFRVRVSQIGGSRSRSLEISAASEDEARREAITKAGEGWKILACERVA